MAAVGAGVTSFCGACPFLLYVHVWPVSAFVQFSHGAVRSHFSFLSLQRKQDTTGRGLLRGLEIESSIATQGRGKTIVQESDEQNRKGDAESKYRRTLFIMSAETRPTVCLKQGMNRNSCMHGYQQASIRDHAKLFRKVSRTLFVLRDSHGRWPRNPRRITIMIERMPQPNEMSEKKNGATLMK